MELILFLLKVLQFRTRLRGIRTVPQSKHVCLLFRDPPCCVRTPTHYNIPPTFNLLYVLPSSRQLHSAELNAECTKNLDQPTLRRCCSNKAKILLQISEPTEFGIEAGLCKYESVSSTETVGGVMMCETY